MVEDFGNQQYLAANLFPRKQRSTKISNIIYKTG